VVVGGGGPRRQLRLEPWRAEVCAIYKASRGRHLSMCGREAHGLDGCLVTCNGCESLVYSHIPQLRALRPAVSLALPK